MNRTKIGSLALVFTLGLAALAHAQDEAPADPPAAEEPAAPGGDGAPAPAGDPAPADPAAPGGEAADFAFSQQEVRKTVEHVIKPEETPGGGGAEDSEPTNLPAELGGGPIYRPGDLLADNRPGTPAVNPRAREVADGLRRVAPLVPGGNPSSPLDPTGVGVTTPADTLDRVMTPAAARINGALTGTGTGGQTTYMGSSTRPTGVFSSNPDVSFTIDGRNVSLTAPSVSRGQSVTYHRVSQPGGGYAIEARSGGTTWQLQYGYNSLLPNWMAGGWEWRQR